MKSVKSNNTNQLILGRFLLFFVLFSGFFAACDSPDAADCLKIAGDRVSKEIQLDTFSKIGVAGDMSLIIRQDSVQSVSLFSGENIIGEVMVEVQDGVLSARYEDGCNLARDYSSTQLVVTTPQLNEIRNGTIYDVEGMGTLRFPRLRLESTTLETDPEPFYNTGGFKLKIDVNNLEIEANGKAFFQLEGEVNQFNINFADKTARLEGTNLIAQEVYVFHRSANQVYVNPQQRLSGVITGVGDVISINRPPEVSVEERYTGRLLFQDAER